MYQKSLSFLSILMVMAMVLAGCVQPEPIMPAEEGAMETSSEDAMDTMSGDLGVGKVALPDNVAEGGVWTRVSSADATILNPILSSDSASSGIHNFLFPTLLGQDPFSGATVPTQMAESWDTSDDGLVWTFNLRDGVVWSDGEAVDADDFKFTYDAIASELVETPRKSNVELIENIEVIDPLTIEVTFSEVKCDGLTDLGLGWLPSHLYAEDFSDIMENELNEAPTVGAGPLTFQSWARDDNTILVRNESYWEGTPFMDGLITRMVPDPGARLAQLQSGEVDVIALQPEQIDIVEAQADLNRFRAFDDGYAYIGLNLADPANPQPGQDEDGNLIAQDPHPILSERAIRLAMAHALDYESIIENVYLGQGYQIAANVLPAVGWAFDDSIEPYAYDQELAMSILDEAGWVDSDGDGVRERDGQLLELSLITNAGNTTREDLGALVQDQFGDIGIKVNFEAIDFGTLVGQLLDQTYDMVIIGWTGLGSDPNDDSFWHTRFDTPGSGFNFVSYHSAELDALLEEGVGIPGCDPAARAPIYQQIQQIIHDDIPYLFVTGNVANTGYSDKWDALNPGEWSFYHNVEQWHSKALQP